MWMAWGPELTFFCNDAYRRDTLGKKYPWALGRPGARGVGGDLAGHRPADRDRPARPARPPGTRRCCCSSSAAATAEETYHTFSYSPLADDDGRVAGMLCVVSEDTERVIGERRHGHAARRSAPVDRRRCTEAEALAAAPRHARADQRSLPFTLIYLYDGTARAAAGDRRSGVAPVAPASLPATTRTGVAASAPSASAGRRRRARARFADLPTGAWTSRRRALSCCRSARARALARLPGGRRSTRYRPSTTSYPGFLVLVAGQLAAGIADARAYEAERRRAEAWPSSTRPRPTSSPTSATSSARR